MTHTAEETEDLPPCPRCQGTGVDRDDEASWMWVCALCNGTGVLEPLDASLEAPLDLGPCCACREAGPTVHNVILLAKRTLVPGTGWGCFQCGLPPDGASVVVCDACLAAGAPWQEAIFGYPSAKQRCALDALTEPFTHDRSRHPGEADTWPSDS